jgi:hypothetical protein
MQDRLTEAEREHVIRALRESYAQGKLTHEQLDERLTTLFAAGSRAELGNVLQSGEAAAPHIAASGSDVLFVQGHLSAGEWIEWVGRPDPGKHFTRADVFLVPFSILWGGFAIAWEVGVIASGAPPFFVLWGIPFVAIGLYFMVGRFFARASRARHTIFAVTNRRVLVILRGRRGESVAAAFIKAIPNVSTTEGSDGRGNVGFGVSSESSWKYANTGFDLSVSAQTTTGLTFYDIEDPQGVAALVERLREAS